MAKKRGNTVPEIEAPSPVETPSLETSAEQTEGSNVADSMIEETPQIETPAERTESAFWRLPDLERKTIDGGAGDRPVIDPLNPDSPVDKFRARYSELQRQAIVEAVERGAIVRAVRVSTITKAAQTGGTRDELINYVTYLPTGRETDLNGDAMDKSLGMTVLSHGVFVRDSDFADSDDDESDDTESEGREQKSAVKHWIYGHDLDLRNPVRTYLNSQLAGPVGEIAKQVKNLIKIKLAKTLTQSLAMVISMRQENGEAVPEGLTLESLGLA